MNDIRPGTGRIDDADDQDLASSRLTIIRTIVHVLFILGIVGGGVWLYVTQEHLVARVREISLAGLLCLLCAHGITQWLGAVRVKLLAAASGKDIHRVDSIALTLINGFLNYFPMQMGVVYRGAVFKYRFGIRYRDYAVLTFVSYMLSLIVGVAIAAVLLVWFRARGFAVPVSMIGLVSGAAVFFTGLLFSHTMVAFMPEYGVFARVKTMVREAQKVHVSRRIMALMSVNEVIILMVTAVRLAITLLCLGHLVGWAEPVVITALAQLSSLVVIVPGGLGLREAIAGWCGSVLMVGLGVTALASALDRIVGLVVIFPGAIIGMVFFGVRRPAISGNK